MKVAKILLVSFILSSSIVSIALAGQWKEESDGWKYVNDDGSFIIDNWYQGNDGNSYYLGNDGVMQVGWFQIGDSWYYAYENGVVAQKEWIKYNGESYYLQEDGKMAVNTVIDGVKVGSDGKKIKDEKNYEGFSGATVVSSGSSHGYGIPAGDYVIYPDPDVYHIQIINGSECIVDKYNFIRLYAGDTLSVKGLYVPVGNLGELDINSSGMFRVGTDIAEGTYQVTPPEDVKGSVNIAICTVFNDIPSSKDGEKPEKNVVSEEYVSKRKGTTTVTVKNGQYLQLINCTANLQRP